MTKKEIDRRKPVWTALSRLWLDTELDERDLDRIAEIMVASGFSLEELYEIYAMEVAPVVYVNLLTVAGEWAGFDDDWLHQSIIASLKSRNGLDRFVLKLKRRLMFYATEDQWTYLRMRVGELKLRGRSLPDSE